MTIHITNRYMLQICLIEMKGFLLAVICFEGFLGPWFLYL